MVQKVVWGVVLAIVLLAGPAAAAGDPRVELSVTGGYTVSDGVNFGPLPVPGVGTFDTIEPEDAASLGARLGVLVNPNTEVGFLFNQQWSTLVLGGYTGTPSIDVGDLGVRNYHGYFAYNFLYPEDKLRPYLLFGLGATQAGSVDFTYNGQSRTLEGNTKFSTTMAAGAKYFPQPKIGFRGEVRLTPTYIKSEADGYWCDPYWGCYVAEDPEYSNQWEFSGGIVVRF